VTAIVHDGQRAGGERREPRFCGFRPLDRGRANPIGQKYFAKLEKKHGKGKALSILAAKLGRAVYYMLLRRRPFELQRFVTA
jgi:hypothetical protein